MVTVRHPRLHAAKKRIAFFRLWAPVLGGIVGLVSAFFLPPTALDFVLFAVMFAWVTIGLEVGLHRYFSHRAFKTSRPVELFLFVSALMAAQGSAIYGVAQHRRHHAFSDTEHDPHSPLVRLEGGHARGLGRLRGWWHAHQGYTFFDPPTNVTLLGSDLTRDTTLRWLDARTQPLWILLGMLLPALVGALVTQTWAGTWNAFLWGGPVRIFIQHQAWFTNASFAHMYGEQPFDTGDNSRNNWLCATWSFGSALQNTHHAFPASAYFSYRWYEMDVAGWFIRALAATGLASDVRMHTPEQLQAKLKRPADAHAAR
jgi:stearoyl-CoA desaturase (delta-9 desaturase)